MSGVAGCHWFVKSVKVTESTGVFFRSFLQDYWTTSITAEAKSWCGKTCRWEGNCWWFGHQAIHHHLGCMKPGKLWDKGTDLNWCRISSTNSIKVRISFRISPRTTSHDRHMRVLTWGCKYTGDTCQIHLEYLNISRWTDLGIFLNGRFFHQILRHTLNYASIPLPNWFFSAKKYSGEASLTVSRDSFF